MLVKTKQKLNYLKGLKVLSKLKAKLHITDVVFV